LITLSEEQWRQISGRYLDKRMTEEGINELSYLEISEEGMNLIFIESRFAREVAILTTFYIVSIGFT
jgi:hypothetical protein